VNRLALKLFGGARWLVLLLLLCAALGPQARAQNENAPAAAAPQQTEPRPDRPGEPRERPADRDRRLMDALNLTPEQRAQLAALAEQTRADVSAAQVRVRLARRALNQAIYAENPDQALIEQRTRELGTAQAEMIRLNAQTELKIRQILTPEQLRAFRILRQRQRQRDQQRPRRLPGDDAPGRLPRQFPNANRRP
jgi:Spy/CpxP family protein refolding chaperone